MNFPSDFLLIHQPSYALNEIRLTYKTPTCFGTEVPSSGNYSEQRGNKASS
jgi:hypothetical protein